MTAELADLADPVVKIAYVVLFAAVSCFGGCVARTPRFWFWAPWDFSWVEFLSAWFAIFWYTCGLSALAAGSQALACAPGHLLCRRALIYCVLETRFEYFAEHQFFYNRIQHVVMHHLGPLLIALAWPGEVLWRGSPAFTRRIVAHPFVMGSSASCSSRCWRQFYFPARSSLADPVGPLPRHDRPQSVQPDELDHGRGRPVVLVPGARSAAVTAGPVSFGTRVALAFVVMLPQIVGGAVIA